MVAVGIPSITPPSGVRIDEAPPTLTPLSTVLVIANPKIAEDTATSTKEIIKTNTMKKMASNSAARIGIPTNTNNANQTRPSPVIPSRTPPLDVPMRTGPNPTLKKNLPEIPDLPTVGQVTGAEAYTFQLLWNSVIVSSPDSARVYRATIAPLDQPAAVLTDEQHHKIGAAYSGTPSVVER